MILIRRKQDNMIVNDRQGNDYQHKAKLESLQTEFDNLPQNTSQEVKTAMQATMTDLQSKRQAWYDRRVQSIIKHMGGTFADYDILSVPDEQRHDVLKARYIEYNEITGVICHPSERYVVEGSTITVFAPQWVKGNYALLSEDITDFSDASYMISMSFKLAFFQDNVSNQIRVELFLWDSETEDEPPNVLQGKTLCQVLVSGTVNLDNTVEVL